MPEANTLTTVTDVQTIIAPPVLVETPVPDSRPDFSAGRTCYVIAVSNPAVDRGKPWFIAQGGGLNPMVTPSWRRYARSWDRPEIARSFLESATPALAKEHRNATFLVCAETDAGLGPIVAAYRIADGQVAEKEVAGG